MEPVWLLLGGGPATSVRSIRLGFLSPGPFRREDPRLWVLDSLGFPWILSSESRLFNGLRGFLPEEYFSPVFPGVMKGPQRASAVKAMRKGGIVHAASLIWFLIYCKKLSSDPFPFDFLHPKARPS
jgi:hypothetical protein